MQALCGLNFLTSVRPLSPSPQHVPVAVRQGLTSVFFFFLFHFSDSWSRFSSIVAFKGRWISDVCAGFYWSSFMEGKQRTAETLLLEDVHIVPLLRETGSVRHRMSVRLHAVMQNMLVIAAESARGCDVSIRRTRQRSSESPGALNAPLLRGLKRAPLCA